MPRPPLPTISQRDSSTESDFDDAGRPTHSQYNINYRQLPNNPGVPTSSSSYDYWWPYPPGGVTTTITSATSSTPPSFNVPNPITSPTVTTQSQLQSLTNPSSLGITSLAATDTIPTSSDSASLDSNSQTQSLISINANATMDSPSSASTFSSYPKHSPNSSPDSSSSTSNSAGSHAQAYLIPIFVVLGVILGSVVAWFGWGCITRKPRLRDFDEDEDFVPIGGKRRSGRRRKSRRSGHELEVGPAYCALTLSEKTFKKNHSYSEDGDHSEKEALSPDGADTDKTFGWKALDMDMDHPQSQEPEHEYLVPPVLPRKSGRQSKAKHQQGLLSRAATGKTVASVSVYSQVGDDDDEEDEGYDNDHDADKMSFLNEFESDYDPRSPRLHPAGARENTKSTAQSTIKSNSASASGRVISVSRRRARPSHIRADSDVHLDSDSSSSHGDTGLSRSTTSVTARTTLTTQTGFRMMDGSPLPTPAMSMAKSGATTTLGGGGGGFFWGTNDPEPEPETKSLHSSRSAKSARTKWRAKDRSESFTSIAGDGTPTRGGATTTSSPSGARARATPTSTKSKKIDRYTVPLLDSESRSTAPERNSSTTSDKYTALPARGSRSRSRSPVKRQSKAGATQRSPSKHDSPKERRKGVSPSRMDKMLERYYGTDNPIPQSPPQITSPKLRDSLCFGSP